MKKEIEVGKKYAKLTVTGKAKAQTKSGVVMWDCVCDCGGTTQASSAKLNFGNKKTCGCAKSKAITKQGAWIPSTHHWYTKASRIISDAKRQGIPFGFANASEFVIYLYEIAPDKCPVFGKKLVVGEGKHHDLSPSVDKIVPSKGYVKGNIQVISYLANRMKNNASPRQLQQFAQWINKGVSK